MTSTDGVVIDERLVMRADATGPRSARTVLHNPRVDFARLRVARGGILRQGLGYERNDVDVILNVSPTTSACAASTRSSSSPTSRRSSSRRSRRRHAVLNADDPLVREMRRQCSGRVV